MKRSVGRFFFDWVLFPAILLAIAYEPNFKHGFIHYHEEGQYAAVIEGLFRGGVPYLDLYLLFGPLTYAGPALAMTLFGKHLAVQRAWFLAGDLAGFLAFYFLCRVLLRGRFWACLVAFLAVLQAHDPFWCTRWAGFRFPCLYLFLAFWCRHLRDGRRADAVLAGTFCALGFLHSSDIGFLAVLTFAASAMAQRVWFRTPSGISGRGFAAGNAVVLAPFAAWLAATGAASAFVSEMLSLGSRRAWAQKQSFLGVDPIRLFVQPWIYGAAALRSIRARGPAGTGSPALFAFAVCALLSYVFSFRSIHGPQFARTVPFFCLALAALAEPGFERYFAGGLGSLRSRVEWRSVGLPLVCAGLLVVTALAPSRHFPNLFEWASYQARKHRLVADPLGRSGSPLLAVGYAVGRAQGIVVPEEEAFEIERIAELVRTRSGPEDSLFAFPDLAMFNFLCERPAPSRFTTAAYAWPREEWRAELLSELENNPPRLALMRTNDSGLLASIRQPQALAKTRTFVKNHYERIGTTSQIDVYERK